MVTNPGGLNGSLANGFSYIGQPTVSNVSPNNGTTLGGTAVTITGTNFASGATVTFGSNAATNVVVVSSTLDHRRHAGRQRRTGDGDGEQSRRAERQLEQRVHLYCYCRAHRPRQFFWSTDGNFGPDLRGGTGVI